MEANTPLSEKEQAQLIEIMQIFMQLPERENLEIKFYADASGSIYNDGELTSHFHDLEEGVEIMRMYANPESEQEQDDLFLEPDPTLE